MQNTYRPPSKLYYDLYQNGGDKLIAVYSMLKISRNKEVQYFSFTSKNNKTVSGYSLLRNKTNLTLHSLKKYIPVLIKMELCHFNAKGDFILLGNNKTKDLYSSYKLVPIIIGKNLVHTAYNSTAVRFHSNEQKQIKKIQKNIDQRVLKCKQNNPSNLKELKAINRLLKVEKKGFENDVTILSICGFSRLKDGTSSKSKGNYWKRKLISKNLVESKNRFEVIKKMSFNEYSSLKSNVGLSYKHCYKNGCLVLKLVCGFKTISV